MTYLMIGSLEWIGGESIMMISLSGRDNFFRIGDPLLITLRIVGKGSRFFQVTDHHSLLRIATPFDLDVDACPWEKVKSYCSARQALAFRSRGLSLVPV